MKHVHGVVTRVSLKKQQFVYMKRASNYNLEETKSGAPLDTNTYCTPGNIV
jgi:hypothetical protein